LAKAKINREKINIRVISYKHCKVYLTFFLNKKHTDLLEVEKSLKILFLIF